MPIIEVEDLRKVYKLGQGYEVEVLKGVNLSLYKGDFLLLTGPSGSGKTTLLNIIGCLDKPTSGIVRILGKIVNGLSDDELSIIRLKEIGFVFQDYNLLPTLTVLKNIELPMALAKIPKEERRARVNQLLKAFNLEELADRYPNTLSAGQQQRVAVIRALANNPKIILADEPTSNIDLENTYKLLEMFKEVNQVYGVTIILTSNHPEPAKKFCMKHLHLKNGILQPSNNT